MDSLGPSVGSADEDKEEEEDDPFACFDSDDDVDDSNNDGNENGNDDGRDKPSSAHTGRDPNCGVLAFHAGTEYALLNFVKAEASRNDTNDIATKPDVTLDLSTRIRQAQQVLSWVDQFCLQRHWMMHIGNEKSQIMEGFVAEFLHAKGEKQGLNNDKRESNDPPARPYVFVELGTYCCYSSIWLAKTLLQLSNAETGAPPITPFRIYTVEVVEEHLNVANEMITLAGMEPYVQALLLDPDQQTLSSLLETSMSGLQQPFSCPTDIDFLFIDHDKSRYLADLKELESAGMIQRGTFVAADNVVFAKIDDYRAYMKDLASRGIVTSRLEETSLEYSAPELLPNKPGHDHDSRKELLKDGIEFSIYLADPEPVD